MKKYPYNKRIKFTLLGLVEMKLMQANNITREVMGTKGNEGTPTTYCASVGDEECQLS